MTQTQGKVKGASSAYIKVWGLVFRGVGRKVRNNEPSKAAVAAAAIVALRS